MPNDLEEMQEVTSFREGPPLISIERPRAQLKLHWRRDDVEVMEVQIAGESSLSERVLWGTSSWHFVVAGLAVFRQDEHDWEVLPGHSLRLFDGRPYTIHNPVREPLRLLSVVVASDTDPETDEPR